MLDHLHFGTGGGGLFVETLANFAALEGEYAAAARLYAAGRSETLRAAMPWPRRSLTDQLLAVTRDNLSPSDYERAWQDGERLTMADIVGHCGVAAGLTELGLERPLAR